MRIKNNSVFLNKPYIEKYMYKDFSNSLKTSNYLHAKNKLQSFIIF